jgi:hypothetical protein
MQRLLRRLLQTSAIICAISGGALWFFGGMNTGPSQWTEKDPNPVLTLSSTETHQRFVVRPGIRFLAGTLAVSALLALASVPFSAAGKPDSHRPRSPVEPKQE